MKPWKRRLLWAAWAGCFAIAAAASALFVQGILRDTRAGEPVVRIDPASAGDWARASFRVWGSGTYKLSISTVNHDSTLVGHPLGADLEVALVDPRGVSFFQHVYPAHSTGHAIPSNYGDTALGTFELDDWPLRRWTLKARVLKPDPRFAARTDVRLRKDRYDPGMGGLMNYVMIIPAGAFLLLSFFAAVPLAAAGSRLPLLASAICGFALLAMLVLGTTSAASLG